MHVLSPHPQSARQPKGSGAIWSLSEGPEPFRRKPVVFILDIALFSCRATRDALGGFESKLQAADMRIEVLAARIEDLEVRLAEKDAPLLLRIVRGFWRFLFGRGR